MRIFTRDPDAVRALLFFILGAFLTIVLSPPLFAADVGIDKEEKAEIEESGKDRPRGEFRRQEGNSRPEVEESSRGLPSVASRDTAMPTKPSVPEPRATLIFKKGKIEQILMSLKKQTGISVMTRGKASNLRIDIIAKDEPVSQILQKIASANNLVLEPIDSTHYELMDQTTYLKQYLPKKVIQKIFLLKYIKAEEAKKSLQNVLTKGIGQIAADPRTNKIIVTDLPQVIELIKRLLDEIDVQLMTRVFYIRHADIAALADKLKNYKSAPGTIEVDPKTHQIIVTDIFQNIKRMEMLVEVLDVGPEMRVYNLTNIGFKGEDVDKLSKAIEQVITKNADVFWQIDVKSGTLIVQDVPEVHEKIEQILAVFDKPTKQVLIYAEVIEASFDRTFDLGINWKYQSEIFNPRQTNITMDGSQLLVGYLNRYVEANLHALLEDKDTRVLLQPRLLVKNQQEATFHVGGTKPYLTTNYYTGTTTYQSAGQASVSYGLEVTMKPSISNNGLVEMDIKIENSDADYVEKIFEDKKYTLVEKKTTEANTTLIIPSGETRVLAGLINTKDTNTKQGIPFLVNIPIIGSALFGSKSEKSNRRNILFFITPTIFEERGTRKHPYRGKSIEEYIKEAEGIPPALEEALTSPTLEAQRGKVPGEAETLPGVPIFTSDRPIELPRLLGLESNLDAETLRQKRLAVTRGPSGTFAGAAPASSIPTSTSRGRTSRPSPPRTTTRKSVKSVPPLPPPPSGPRRPSTRPETKY